MIAGVALVMMPLVVAVVSLRPSNSNTLKMKIPVNAWSAITP